jgi:hypothetical protein
MKIKKRIAIIVRDRQEEALRMALGIAILDDMVDIYLLDTEIEETEKNILNIEMIRAMGLKIYTNSRGDSGLNYLSTEEIAARLLEYDHIIPY